MLRKAFVVLPALLLLSAVVALAQASRDFTFHYSFTVKNVPAGQKLRIWFPAGHSDSFQQMRAITENGDLPLKKTRESKYGNEIYYAEIGKTKQAEYHFEVIYDVVRHERVTLGVSTPHLADVTLTSREKKLDLAPDALVPITGLPADLAKKVTDGQSGQLNKARAIYDYVFATMKYDKTGTGWGRGDVLYACDAHKGNCTDFHSLFISMARSQDIPARFEIGFPLPADKHSAEIAGYHCWAEFFEPKHGWIPVDISEAWKHPEKKDYFFGAHDENRVQFSMGRDLELNPKQDGPPLNYFVYPYVELEGKEYPTVSNAFSFADAGSEADAMVH
jgi:transglutaminase-like putative cysteine protease